MVKIIAFFQGDVPAYELAESAAKEGKVTFFKARGKSEDDVIVLGMGEKDQDPEKIRVCGGALARFLRTLERDETAVLSPLEIACPFFVEALYEGFYLGAYEFNRYFGTEHKTYEIRLEVSGGALPSEEIQKAAAKAKNTADSVAFARDLTNEVPDVIYPESFGEALKKHFKGTEVEVIVHKAKDLEKMGFQGILSVGRGSARSPAMVELRYQTAKEKPLLALVGKGITFDMGGYSMKSGRDLSSMKGDMAGAGAVAGTFDLLLRREAKANVIGIIPLAENLIGENAILPSHVISYKNGKTVQVANIDAEGRLILADGLLYAEELGAKTAIDIATLTGNIGQALGLRLAGAFGDSALVEELCAVGKKVGDKLWPMPIVKEYGEAFKTPYTDLCNISSGALGGAIYATLFLENFKGNMTWAHLDVAASAQTEVPYAYYPVGATGVGVRLFADYAEK